MKALTIKALILMLAVAFFSSCTEESFDQLNEDSSLEEITDHDHTRCGKDHHMDKLMTDPEYRAAYQERMAQHKSFVSEMVDNRATCSSPVTIPVAVHYQGATSSDVTCLRALAAQSVAILNADYQGNNSDITNWTGNASSTFPSITYGEACLEFVIADTNHPSGYGLANGDPAVTINQTNGDQVNAWSGYLNIFVNDADGALGYSPLGGAGNGDGVVISRDAFGGGSSCGNTGSSAPYNLGRTLTHEVGHYLLLDHIWGNGCGTDDGIADTPNSSTDYGGCPNLGASSCGSVDLHMNYMDYTNDACMYMFTAGQATVSENYVASSLSNLTSNASNVISGNSGGGGGTGGGNTGGGNTGGGNTGGGSGATCDIPTSTSVELLSSTSVKVSWTAMPQAIKYQVRYRVQGTSTWTTKTATTPEKTLVSLSPGTTYEYKVRTRCPAAWTAFTTTETFTTTGNNGAASCDKPGFSSVEVLTNSKTKVSWEAMPEARIYQVRYRRLGIGGWIGRNSTATNRTLNGLVQGQTYEYKIRTLCPSGWSAYTTPETFVQTLNPPGGGGGNGGGSTSNSLTFNLTLDYYGSETSWELVNSNNQVIENGGPFADDNSGQVVSELFNIPDGCYTLYVDDSYGDGICCNYGNGSFELLDVNGTQVGYSNGQFGNYDFIDFCVTGNVVTFKGQETDPVETGMAPKTRHMNQ